MYLIFSEMIVLIHIYSAQTLLLHLKCNQSVFFIYVD